MHNCLRKIPADLWVFDCDGTLYTNTQEIKSAVENLMVAFIKKEYNIGFREAKALREALLRKYDTRYTAIALRNEGIDVSRFIQSTYLSVSPEDYGIRESKPLYELISSLKGDKIILTNNPSNFARRILKTLGVLSLFSNIFGMEELNFMIKPAPEAFNPLKEKLGKGKLVVVVEDNSENAQMAKKMGCIVALIGKQNHLDWTPDFYLDSLI